MSKQYYYLPSDNICYTKEYFIDYMKENNLTKLEVFKAVPEKIPDLAWCKKNYGEIETDDSWCGKTCGTYSPRNGKSGCCKHYTTTWYERGDKVTLKL